MYNEFMNQIVLKIKTPSQKAVRTPDHQCYSSSIISIKGQISLKREP